MKKIVAAVLGFALVLGLVGCGDSGRYKKASEALDASEYSTVIEILNTIPDYEDSDNLRERANAGTLRQIAESSTSPECIEVASDGSFIKIDTNPHNEEKFYNPDYIQTVKDINKALGFPESLWEKMGQTRALDGTLTDENDTFKVSWSYHPDNGMTVLYERK